MSSFPWISQLEFATEAHHIREIFNKCFMIIREPEVHNAFYERIHDLRSWSVDAQVVRDLDDLKEDIELEVEHGTMLRNLTKKSSRGEVQHKGNRVKFIDASCSKASEAKKIEFADSLLSSIEFKGKSNLMDQVERELTMRVLKECEGNRTQTCRLLGISIRTLRNKLIRYRKEGYFPIQEPLTLINSDDEEIIQ